MNCEKPLSISAACTLKIRGGCERDVYGKKAGKGPLVQWERSGTLGVSQDQTLFVWNTFSPSRGGRTSSGKQGGDGWRMDVMYTLNRMEVHGVCYALDQQGGKGGGNYLKEVCPTILSDSHGTPHAVACIGVDLYNQTTTGGVENLE